MPIWVHAATRELGMQSELHENVVHHGVELLLLVSIPFLPAIHKSLLILKEFLYTSLYTFAYPKDFGYIRLILVLTKNPFLKLDENCVEHQAQLCHSR